MGFQETKNRIHWKVHFSSSIEQVFAAISTDGGRESFWAEEAKEQDGHIEFRILNYPAYQAKILGSRSPDFFHLEYFGTDVTFRLQSIEDGGTDLTLTAITSSEETRYEMTAGWVSVLMAMKAAIDHGIDLRNHHPDRVWENGYLDN